MVDPLPRSSHLSLDADQQATDVVTLSEQESVPELGGVGNGSTVTVALVLLGIQVQNVSLPLLRVLLADDDAKLSLFQVNGHGFLLVVERRD